jgi:hypothetical protein
MINHEYQNQLLREEVKGLKHNFDCIDNECSRLESRNEELEKQAESMRCCGNCENENPTGSCRLSKPTNYTCINSKYKHWQPKEAKND